MHTFDMVVQLGDERMPRDYYRARTDNSGFDFVPAGVSTRTIYADLHATRVELSEDDTRAPYIHAELTIPIPDPVTYDRLDPRVETRRIVITATRADLGGATTTREFDLQLRSRDVDWDAGTIRLTADSDEAALMDKKFYAPKYGVNLPDYPSLYVRDQLQLVVFYWASEWSKQRTLGSPPIGFTTKHPLFGTADARLPDGADLTWSRGDDFWDGVDAWLTATNLRLYVDAARRWWLVRRDAAAAGTNVELDYRTTITRRGEAISRDDDTWADTVMVHYTWQVYQAADDTFVPKEAWDVYAPPRSDNLPRPYPSSKAIVIEVAGKKTAGGAAQAIARRRADRARSTTITATPTLDIDPGRPATAYLDQLLPVQSGTVSAVRWLWSDTEAGMEVTLRGARTGSAHSWASIPPGFSWDSIPVGQSWAQLEGNPTAYSWANMPAGRTWDSIPVGTSWPEL